MHKRSQPRIFDKRTRTTGTARCTDYVWSASGMGEDQQKRYSFSACTWRDTEERLRDGEAPPRWGLGCGPT
eukprot:8020617-Pyramimonas_sp.AAC.1